MNNFSINDFFLPLYEILIEFNLNRIENWERLSGKRRKDLNIQIALFYKENLKYIIPIIEDSQGIILSFDKFNPSWYKCEKLAKKAVFYSDVSIVIIENELKIYQSDDSNFAFKKSASDGYSSSGTLKSLISVLIDIKPLVLKGIVLPIPVNLNFGNYDFDAFNSKTFDLINHYNYLVDKIKDKKLSDYIIPISLDKRKILRQIEEIQEFLPSIRGLKPIQLYLPYLKNIDIDTLIGLREDNYDYFLNYQNAIRSYIISTPKIHSENAFLEIAGKINNEIEILSDKMQSIRRQRNKKGAEILIGTGVSMLTLLMDQDLAKYLTAIIGTKTTLDVFPFLRMQSKQNITNNDYYMAYLVHKASSERNIIKQ